MKDNSFDRAMQQIVGQAEAEKLHEIKMQKRAAILGRVRSVFYVLLLLTVGVFAFNYREQIQAQMFPKKVKATVAGSGQTAASLNAAQQNADTRDKVIAEITK